MVPRPLPLVLPVVGVVVVVVGVVVVVIGVVVVVVGVVVVVVGVVVVVVGVVVVVVGVVVVVVGVVVVVVGVVVVGVPLAGDPKAGRFCLLIPPFESTTVESLTWRRPSTPSHSIVRFTRASRDVSIPEPCDTMRGEWPGVRSTTRLDPPDVGG
jgi:hypothetical protein